jgi:hypothetical protein
MKTNLLKLALLASNVVLLGACHTQDPEPVTGNGQAGEADTVTGIVVDTNDRPIAGAKVRADNDILYGGSAEVITDTDGRYKLPKLAIGGWKVYAWKDVTYKGQVYHLRMGMDKAQDYNSFSPGQGGAVKNFKWQLAGTIPDRPQQEQSSSGYFGGALRFTNMDSDANSMPRGTEVTITLTPVAGATRFDGSAPQTIRKSFTIEGGNKYNYWLHDIPQSEYRITAESNYNGARRVIELSDNIYRNYAPTIDGFYFKPASRSYESGLQGPEDTPFYMHQQ